jgi:hypothetical protein
VRELGLIGFAVVLIGTAVVTVLVPALREEDRDEPTGPSHEEAGAAPGDRSRETTGATADGTPGDASSPESR